MEARLSNILPLQDIACVVAVAVEPGGDEKRDLQAADSDLGLERQPRRIGKQPALVIGISVKRIDAGSDDLFGVEIRPKTAEFGDVAGQQFHCRLVDVSHSEIAVDHHHGGRDVFRDLTLCKIDPGTNRFAIRTTDPSHYGLHSGKR